ncbi:MAG: gluconokinase, partial [Candidatus Binataceae bacterium]
MVIVLMGVSGSGKTTIGQILACRLGWPFYDADDFHSIQNRDKMHHGEPLTDDDRLPWLNALREFIEHCARNHIDAVLACSALKQSYRDWIAPDPSAVRVVYLKGASELIARRLAARHGHFFNPALLQSQFDALEEPAGATV